MEHLYDEKVDSEQIIQFDHLRSLCLSTPNCFLIY